MGDSNFCSELNTYGFYEAILTTIIVTLLRRRITPVTAIIIFSSNILFYTIFYLSSCLPVYYGDVTSQKYLNDRNNPDFERLDSPRRRSNSNFKPFDQANVQYYEHFWIGATPTKPETEYTRLIQQIKHELKIKNSKFQVMQLLQDMENYNFADDKDMREKLEPETYYKLHKILHMKKVELTMKILSNAQPEWLKVRNSLVVSDTVDRTFKNPGLPPSEILKKENKEFYKNLQVYELSELMHMSNKFKRVWFVGTKNAMKTKINLNARNDGFDTEPNAPKQAGHEQDSAANIVQSLGGSYKINIGDHISYRYEIEKFIAAGAYGQVLLVKDHALERELALKIMDNHTKIESPRQDMELHAVRFLNRHALPSEKPFLVDIYDVSTFRNHQILAYELLGESLYSKYGSGQDLVTVRGDMLKKITWDLLEGLVVLDRIELVHNDLKPENVVFTGKEYPFVKIIDYGIACYRNHNFSSIEEERVGMKCPEYYVMTRFYRAPEVMLALNYTTKADMWSLGCIVGELYRGKELIFGEREVDQFAAVMEIIGLPPVSMIEESWRKDLYYRAVSYKTDGGFQRKPYRKSLKMTLQTEDAQFLDFMDKILTWEPNRRASPLEAMNHPWLKEFAKKRFGVLMERIGERGGVNQLSSVD